MAPIFASPDIAAIVAAFPPPLPFRGHATLLRSASGERLLNSTQVLARLEKILASNTERVEVSQLSSLLGIKNASILLDTTEDAFFYSRDKSRLLSVAERRRISDELGNATRSDFVNLDVWSEQRDVERKVLDQAVNLVEGLHVRITSDGKRFAYHLSHLERCQRELKESIEKTRPEKCDVGVALLRTSPKLHSWIAQTTIAAEKVKSSVQSDDRHVLVVPDEYEEYQMAKRAAENDLEVQTHLDELEDRGCTVARNELVHRDVLERYRAEHPGDDLYDWRLDQNDTRVLAPTSLSESVRIVLEELSKEALLDAWMLSDADALPVLNKELISALLNSKIDLDLAPASDAKLGAKVRRLANLLLNCDGLINTLSKTCNPYMKSIKALEEEKWAKALIDRIACPFELYSRSESFADEKLRSRLVGPLMLAFEHEHLQPAKEFAQVLLRKKSRSQKFDIFGSSDPASLLETRSAVKRVLQTFHLSDQFNPPRIRADKFFILRNKDREIQDSTNGPWILQNVIWMLLSRMAQMQGQDILFASSGKDTTRMLRLYQNLVKSTECSEEEKMNGRHYFRIVEQFKEKVNTKEVTDDDLKGMRELSRAVLHGMVRMALADMPPAASRGEESGSRELEQELRQDSHVAPETE